MKRQDPLELCLIAALAVCVLLGASGPAAAQSGGRAAMLRQQAQMFYSQAKLEEAAELYRRAAMLEGSPELKAEAFVTTAWLEHQLGRTEEARSTLTQALVLLPDFPFLAELYDAEFEASYYDALQEARRQRQDLARSKTDEAIEMLERGWTREAGELFREVLRLAPNDLKVLYNLALVEIQEEHAEEAITALQRVVSLSYSARDAGPNAREYRRRALLRLGLLYHERGLHEEAVQHLTDATRLDPDGVDAWRVLGLSQQALGNLDGAIEALHQAVELAPDDESLVTGLVAVLQQAGEWREVLRVTRTSAPRFPRNARLWLSLGQAARRARDTSTSLDALERALGLDPENHQDLGRQAAALLSSQYLRQHRYSEAERRARQWVAWQPEAAEARSILGTALQQRGLISDALDSHLAAQRLEPSRADFAYNAGTAHLGLDELRKAAYQFRRALTLDAGHPDAPDSLDAIRQRLQNASRRLGMRISDSPSGAVGALVTSVLKRTPAAKANLKQGDLIRGFDGRPIGSAEEFGYELVESTAGQVSLTFVRKVKRKETILRLR